MLAVLRDDQGRENRGYSKGRIAPHGQLGKRIALTGSAPRSFLQDFRIRHDLHVNPEKSCKSCKNDSHSSDELPAALDSAFQISGSVPHVWPRCCGRNPNRTISPFPTLTSASAIC